jgi:hypothetical protein
MMKRWTGRWLMAVGALHVPFALIRHRALWAEIGEAGVFDAVAGHAERGHAAWFLIAGPALLLSGVLVDALEKAQLRPPLALGVAMLFMAVLLLVLMPRSGGWLLLPPAFAMIARATRPTAW